MDRGIREGRDLGEHAGAGGPGRGLCSSRCPGAGLGSGAGQVTPRPARQLLLLGPSDVHVHAPRHAHPHPHTRRHAWSPDSEVPGTQRARAPGRLAFPGHLGKRWPLPVPSSPSHPWPPAQSAQGRGFSQQGLRCAGSRTGEATGSSGGFLVSL